MRELNGSAIEQSTDDLRRAAPTATVRFTGKTSQWRLESWALRRWEDSYRPDRRKPPHSTVTLFARFRGLSTSVPRAQAVWYASNCSGTTCRMGLSAP